MALRARRHGRTRARRRTGRAGRARHRAAPPRWVHRARSFYRGVAARPRAGRTAEPLRVPDERTTPQTPRARTKTQAKRGDKAKQALAPALKFKAVDEKAFDKLARNVERLAAGSVATTAVVVSLYMRHRRDPRATRHRRRWARAEGGGAAAPLAVVAELASPPAGEDEYGHEVVDVANAPAAAAFLAAGHGVIDVAAMLGLRVDAHPGSTAGGTDGLHFCMPGPRATRGSRVLSRVGSAFDRRLRLPFGASLSARGAGPTPRAIAATATRGAVTSAPRSTTAARDASTRPSAFPAAQPSRSACCRRRRVRAPSSARFLSHQHAFSVVIASIYSRVNVGAKFSF